MTTPAAHGHKHTGSVTQNHKAHLATAYNELGKELSSTKLRVVGNYTLGKVIGEGAYGKVRLGTHRITSTRVAIKQIPKGLSASLTREIHHHRQLHHPHVTQMYEVLATESSIWLVTELCCGGELFDYLAEKGRIAEPEARVLFGQLCLAVAYLHAKGVVHRDLKLENVLMDERCRIKLGDFGFTREFERSALLETFCGTTGYAAPEMLMGRKYLGPEVDVWSLGIILYCLLTGMLPFDDDDEALMRKKIIKGDFEDPEWLSTESRDLIKNILQHDPNKRLTIPQILAHPWFTARPHLNWPDSAFSSPLQPTPYTHAPTFTEYPDPSESSTHSTTSGESAFRSDTSTSPPTTPDETSSADPFDAAPAIHRNPSETTLKKADRHHAEIARVRPKSTGSSGIPSQPETVAEEPDDLDAGPSDATTQAARFAKPPPAYPTRTPVRTKRRSVSSNLSDPASGSPTTTAHEKHAAPQDFSSLLSTPAPIIFSTPLERELLNSLSVLGFDTGQIVHSVLSDACDAAGALWWMLKRKAEKRAADEAGASAKSAWFGEEPVKKSEGVMRAVGVQTESGGFHTHAHALSLARSAPQLAFLPPTPTAAIHPITPPKQKSPANVRPLLSPASTVELGHRSQPSTPSGSVRDRDKDKDSGKMRREGKARSGSVSIMQRATTALEAAGLVRKKSSEAVREEKERERERSKEADRKIASGEETRSSHSASSRLTKSPPLKAKDHAVAVPSTPPPPDLHHPQPQVGSPWVLAGRVSPPPSYAPTPANSPGLGPSPPLLVNTVKVTPGPRHRANLLTAFRLWFHEDRKGKRKESAIMPSAGSGPQYTRPFTSPGPTYTSGSKRTGSRRSSGHRAQRPSVSSRRSSSVNSRRSSGTSAQMIVLDTPVPVLDQPPAHRRSFGTHTPNSERGEYSSRPSSVRSFSMPRHRKSPSASSSGSAAHFRTTSPIQQKYHRRAGSGSSTRVVRQTQASTTPKSPHMRSNSATSSIHSLVSSRPASYYEPSESDGQRTSSPFKAQSKHSADDSRRANYSSNTTFVAQKRQGPFMSPVAHAYVNSVGRSSWKKSWGLEPPGWQSRTAHIPIEVLAISPATDGAGGLRDVFSGRQSLSLGDESDWVDEEDDIPAFAGGLGQLAASTSAPSSSSVFGSGHVVESLTLSPPPKGHRPSAKRMNRNNNTSSGSGSSGTTRQKTGHSPAERASPIPADNAYDSLDARGGRRQLPAGRSGPAFRGTAIQEEDEGEEE